MKGKDLFFKRRGSTGHQHGKRPALTIRRAINEDVPVIYKHATEQALGRSDADNVSRSGFLISEFSFAAYEGFIDSSDEFYVLLAGKELTAYVMAVSSENMGDCIAKEKIAEQEPDDYIYIQQVCTGNEHQHKGYAQLLYRHIIGITGRAVYASIVDDEELVNTRSIDFHEKMGFQFVMHYQAEDGYRRAVYCFRPDGPKTPALLMYSLFKTGAVAAAALILSLVIAISSADYRTLGMALVAVLYFAVICYSRLKRYRDGAMVEVVAVCTGADKVGRGKVEYCMDMGGGDEDANEAPRVFYLSFPKKRRLREGEQYELMFDMRQDGAVSEANLVAYRQIASNPVVQKDRRK